MTTSACVDFSAEVAPARSSFYDPTLVDDALRSMAATDEDLTRTVSDVQLTRVKAALDAQPRRVYVKQATPIERMDVLTEDLCGAELFIKRDDLLPLAGGGSKTRKLEYLVQAALDAGADTLVTCGAVQSNHCRLTASAAAREGLDCHLILEERIPGSYAANAGGNNYIFQLLGATTSVVSDGQVPAEEERIMARLRAEGKKPYWIPGGGSNALGSLGYARAAVEVLEWTHANGALDAIVLCSGSGGTHAGMLAGLRAAGDATPVIGISTRAGAHAQALKIHKLAAEIAERFGANVAEADVIVHDEHVGPGYSLPTDEMADALETFARREGIILDPVYSGKGAAGLLHLVRSGVLHKGKRVLFLHTGGAPSLYHYRTMPSKKVEATDGAAAALAGVRLAASRVTLSHDELASVYGAA
eukprot:CAMPEP_0206057368 /NCGR_PEP_ID=MMETSP1466-20131121/44227_1 /ASSEMBLY_ACC=CAM_ASM_001126 /TAXON_ID=44452 /ORGANISM="Pavlova gyrans, Strain CCMP608" /LENGTH=416 /DNA_ID=CAMNT_0053432641 /DNA_START=54 /DNA_END=1304 /DNA_ORIENTATION=-